MTTTAIILSVVAMLIIPVVAAFLFSLFRGVRTAADGPVLIVRQDPHEETHDAMVFELAVPSTVKRVVVERIMLERSFADQSGARSPAGFVAHTPVAPPDYDAFEPDLEELAERHGDTPDDATIEAEKRSQYEDVRRAHQDLHESVVMWKGAMVVRHGKPQQLAIPIRTGVAASGRVTFVFSYRTGLASNTATAFADYRPRLAAVRA